MSGLVFFMTVLFALAALGSFAMTIGVDSREDFADDRAPARGLTT